MLWAPGHEEAVSLGRWEQTQGGNRFAPAEDLASLDQVDAGAVFASVQSHIGAVSRYDLDHRHHNPAGGTDCTHLVLACPNVPAGPGARILDRVRRGQRGPGRVPGNVPNCAILTSRNSSELR